MMIKNDIPILEYDSEKTAVIMPDHEKLEYRKAEGCSVVEMECSALAACAQMRGVIWGELLFTADTLADADHYDERNWGGDSLEYALELCIESVMNI